MRLCTNNCFIHASIQELDNTRFFRKENVMEKFATLLPRRGTKDLKVIVYFLRQHPNIFMYCFRIVELRLSSWIKSMLRLSKNCYVSFIPAILPLTLPTCIPYFTLASFWNCESLSSKNSAVASSNGVFK